MSRSALVGPVCKASRATHISGEVGICHIAAPPSCLVRRGLGDLQKSCVVCGISNTHIAILQISEEKIGLWATAVTIHCRATRNIDFPVDAIGGPCGIAGAAIVSVVHVVIHEHTGRNSLGGATDNLSITVERDLVALVDSCNKFRWGIGHFLPVVVNNCVSPRRHVGARGFDSKQDRAACAQGTAVPCCNLDRNIVIAITSKRVCFFVNKRETSRRGL